MILLDFSDGILARALRVSSTADRAICLGKKLLSQR